MSSKSEKAEKKYSVFINSCAVLLLLILINQQVAEAQVNNYVVQPMMRDNSACPRPVVIIKADDLGGIDFISTPHKTWERFFDIIESYAPYPICASIGIISDNIPLMMRIIKTSRIRLSQLHIYHIEKQTF